MLTTDVDVPKVKETTMDELPGEIEQTRTLMRRAPKDVVLMPVMDVRLAQQRLQELQEFCANYLQESKDGGTDGGDYGTIPGAGKRKTLFKSGAEKLCDVYGLADRYVIVSKVEDFDHGLFDYTIQCELVRKTDEMFVGSGLGSCSSFESKYRWREQQRTCPTCGVAAIIKGKEEYGGGWLCWKKKQGCGATFSDNDPAIVGQKTGRIENPDIIDAKNTVLKIAKKRAKIDAVIGVTRSSGIFTQDLEEHELPDIIEAVVSTTLQPVTTGSVVDVPPVQATNGNPETHAEKIARIKAEAAARQPQTVAPTEPTEPVEPVRSNPPPPAAPGPVSADGTARITGINARNGPMIVKDGKSQPSWGPLFIIAFSQKVKASDGTLVTDASTFDQALAGEAEKARDVGTPVKPVVVPGKKKGSFNVTAFE
jgi:hypothetical protein